MKPRMRLGDFLIAYLRRVGVTHLFGIPGDLVINATGPETLRFLPPLIVGESEVDEATRRLAAVLGP